MANRKHKRRRVRRPAVIGRSIRLTAHGWLRQRKAPEAAPPDESAYQPPPMPRGMAEMSEGQSRRPHPLFFVLLAAAITFIAVIARLVSEMSSR